MNEPIANDIMECFYLLRERYPTEEVALSVWQRPGHQGPEFSGHIGEKDSVYIGLRGSPASALESLIAEAGDRNPVAVIDRRVEALKKELAQLDAQKADLLAGFTKKP